MAENGQYKNNDDEISLIDLFVVLLKYRKMIAVAAVLGLVVSACYYVIRAGKNTPAERPSELSGLSEGRMMVLMNPRMGRGGGDRFPAWFNSRALFSSALEEAGLDDDLGFESFTVTYQNDWVDIVLKPSSADGERVEKFFSLLLRNAESLAAVYYARYAADIISYFESLRDQGKDYSAQDYIRYQWAGDLLSGSDTVLKTLYPPFAFAGSGAPAAASASGRRGFPQTVSLVIFFAFLFFAVFLAFVLNTLKSIGADSGAMVKIHRALGKESKDKE